jgi:hypothetical protein
MSGGGTSAKICAHCGRVIEPRGVRDADWAAMKYCSASCRRQAGARVHHHLERAIVALLSERGAGSSICPSEAARAVFGEGFRDHMEDARRAARRLSHRGVTVITQKRRVVDPATFRGPIRIARGPAFETH